MFSLNLDPIILLKFFEDEDAYLCLSDLMDVCSMMQFPIVPQDVVRFHSIPFSLKDLDEMDAMSPH